MELPRLSGKRILVAVSGSIAAYKAVELVRRFQDLGARVKVTMTANATRFIAPLTFEAVSQHPVLVDEFSDRHTEAIGHIAWSEGADLAVIAPATANVIGKLASGIADDALTATMLACDCPVVVAPAMNTRMFQQAAVQNNLDVLRDRGVAIVPPDEGWLACGDRGPGRLARLDEIVRTAAAMMAPADLEGETVLVTAGPTREPLDDVRFISNPSTGKMGYALAASARAHGASVVLVTGPTSLTPPASVEIVPVTTAEEMRRAVMEHAGGAGIVIMAAAVSDFRPVSSVAGKVKKDEAPAMLLLERTDDILAGLGRNKGDRVLVGFAAESENMLANAMEKLRKKNLDLIVANDISRRGSGFGSDTNMVTIIDREGGARETSLLPKTAIAEMIITEVAQLKVKQRNMP